MADIYLPTLHTFAMNNIFTGSWESLRFKIKPDVVKFPSSKDVDMENSSICAEFWHGPYCYEKSTVEGQAVFPMSEEGRAAMKKWLEENI